MSGYETPGIPIYVTSKVRSLMNVDFRTVVLTAGKHGVVGLLRAANLDLYENFGICLNSVAPGPVLTNLANSFALRNISERTTVGKPEEPYVFENQEPIYPAIAAAYLFSNDMHGKAILVFGGKFREIEGVYESVRENMLGGALGMPPISDKGWRNLFSCSF